MAEGKFELWEAGLVREPVLSWNELYGSCRIDEEPLTDERVRALFHSPPVAFVLGSVTTRVAAIARADDFKSSCTRYRYLARLTTRCVPLGWTTVTSMAEFAAPGADAGVAGGRGSAPSERKFSAALDRATVCDAFRDARRNLVAEAGDEVCLNPTAYPLAGKYRFYERLGTVYEGRHDISQIDATGAFDAIFSLLRDGRTCRFGALVELVAETASATREESATYLSGLAAAGVLEIGPRPVLSSSIQADENLRRAVELAKRSPQFAHIVGAIRALDERGDDETAVATNARIAALLPPSGGTWGIDTHVSDPVARLVLPRELKQDIERVLGSVAPAALVPYFPLSRFIERFRQKYGEGSVPLLECVDPLVGIDVDLEGAAATQLPILDKALFRLWERSRCDGTMSVELDADVLNEQPLGSGSGVAATSGVVQVELVSEDGLYHLQGMTFCPPSRFFSRFLAHHEPLADMVRGRRESEAEEGVVAADVLFLATKRLANISTSPPGTRHVIVCDDQDVPAGCVPIPLSDLSVKLEGDRLVLRSESLDAIVEPCFNSPINGAIWNRPAITLLGHLDRHGKPVYRLSWPQAIRDAAFLPRLTSGNCILSLACWNLGADATLNLRKASRPGEIRQILRDIGVPRFFTCGRFDQLVTFDLESDISLLCFRSECEDAREVAVVESLISERVGRDAPRINQIHIPFDLQAAGPPRDVVDATDPVFPAVFRPGEEWATLKLYGSSGALEDLVRTLGEEPIASSLQRADLHRWFFLRYRDPEPHIRLRMQADRQTLWRDLVPSVLDAFNSPTLRRLISNIVIEPYVRETQRYRGNEGMVVFERAFHADSLNAVAATIARGPAPSEEAILCSALLHIHQWFDWFDVELPARRDLLRRMRGRAVVRNEAARLFKLAHAFLAGLSRGGSPSEVLRLHRAAGPVGFLTAGVDKQDWSIIEPAAPSLFHMAVNRIHPQASHPTEAALYDVLARGYEMALKRNP